MASIAVQLLLFENCTPCALCTYNNFACCRGTRYYLDFSQLSRYGLRPVCVQRVLLRLPVSNGRYTAVTTGVYLYIPSYNDAANIAVYDIIIQPVAQC